jgi:pimeloyl-ACP methyl ester carboxylesterase
LRSHYVEAGNGDRIIVLLHGFPQTWWEWRQVIPILANAGFELYRAFDQDVENNRDALKRNGKLEIPVLAVFGSISNTGPRVEEMMWEVADNVTGLCVPNAAHWIAEENPEAFTSGLLRFVANTEAK